MEPQGWRKPFCRNSLNLTPLKISWLFPFLSICSYHDYFFFHTSSKEKLRILPEQQLITPDNKRDIQALFSVQLPYPTFSKKKLFATWVHTPSVQHIASCWCENAYAYTLVSPRQSAVEGENAALKIKTPATMEVASSTGVAGQLHSAYHLGQQQSHPALDVSLWVLALSSPHGLGLPTSPLSFLSIHAIIPFLLLPSAR